MKPWQPVTGGGLMFAFSFTAYVLWFSFTGDGWVPLVDDANFAVHEAGHPVFGLISPRLGVYGGTLAQLLFPLICMIEFARRDWTLSYALCMIWLAESVLNVARYLGDARAMLLPLKGFSDHPMHDWNVILARWGLLNQDALLATGLRVFACLAIVWALVFLVLRRKQDAVRRENARAMLPGEVADAPSIHDR